jgi:hypothetical protein
MSARRLLPVLVLAFASSCADDSGARGPCLDGMVRKPGPACTLPPTLDMTIDGNRADWTNQLVFDVLIPGSCCRAGDTGVTNAGRQLRDGALVFYSNALGFPGVDTTFRYGLDFRRIDLPDGAPGNVHTLLLASVGSNSLEEYVNGERVYGAPGEVAIGVTGIEWRIPATALPYAGAAHVTGVTFDVVDGQVVARDPSTSSTKLCWDVDAVGEDPCRAE